MARVLVVDDALYIRTLVRRILEAEGHEVVGEAADGREAIWEFHRLQPDVIVLDIVLPELDGLEVIQAIRRLDANACVIVHSAYGYREKVLQALEHGATDYVVKTPDSMPRLRDAIEKALGAAAVAVA